MKKIDEAWLAERERIHGAATPGKWVPAVGYWHGPADAAAIADAHNALPLLIAEVRRLLADQKVILAIDRLSLAEIARLGSLSAAATTATCPCASARSTGRWSAGNAQRGASCETRWEGVSTVTVATWVEDGVPVWYHPDISSLMPRYAGVVDGTQWLLGGHTLVARLRDMDDNYRRLAGRSYVVAAAVLALSPRGGS